MTKKSKKEILLVDDSEFSRTILSTYLENQGYSISHATNGQEALSLIDDKLPGPFEAIISDCQMPLWMVRLLLKYAVRLHIQAITIFVLYWLALNRKMDLKKLITFF